MWRDQSDNMRLKSIHDLTWIKIQSYGWCSPAFLIFPLIIGNYWHVDCWQQRLQCCGSHVGSNLLLYMKKKQLLALK
jgi:hypothetical protein